MPTIVVGWEDWLSSQLNAQVLVTLIQEHYGYPVELYDFDNENFSDAMSNNGMDVGFEIWDSYLPIYRAELALPIIGWSE